MLGPYPDDLGDLLMGLSSRWCLGVEGRDVGRTSSVNPAPVDEGLSMKMMIGPVAYRCELRSETLPSEVSPAGQCVGFAT